MKFTDNKDIKNELKEKHAQYMPKETMTLEGYPVIEGYNFEKGKDYSEIIYSVGKNLNAMTIKNGKIIYQEDEL